MGIRTGSKPIVIDDKDDLWPLKGPKPKGEKQVWPPGGVSFI